MSVNEDTKIKLMEKLTQFCIAKSIKFTEVQIEFNTTMLLRRFDMIAVSSAIDELFFETPFFPEASVIAKKINEIAQVGNSKGTAEKKAAQLIEIIHDEGFDPVRIKEKLGEAVYSAIGGAQTIRSYGQGDFDIGIFKAQIRNAIEPIVKRPEEKKQLEKAGALTESGARSLSMTAFAKQIPGV